MEKSAKFETLQPRFLRYRSHYKIYLVSMLSLTGMVLSFWGFQLSQRSGIEVYREFHYELWMTLCYFMVCACFYAFWLRYRLNRSVQVFEEKICLHSGKHVEEIPFDQVESIGIVCWSLFYLKMKDGFKHYFNSSLERVDYIWEGLHQTRPELFEGIDFEDFRTKLVQYDHHQKRKEWFFRHKLEDVFIWVFLPLAFMVSTYFIQTREIMVHQTGLYFFRLFMYSVLVLLSTTFVFSMLLKKFIFDRKIKIQMSSQPDDKIRNLEYEGIVLQRSKIMQTFTVVFLFACLVRMDMNLFSVTKVKGDLSSFNLKAGKTVIVDNRYNCVMCKYPVKDGDIVIFGKGTIGQIMAREGDMVGQLTQDRKGRVIASENIQEVPKGYVAVKLANEKEIYMVKVGELIGKIQK